MCFVFLGAVVEGSARRTVRDGVHVMDGTVSLQNWRRSQSRRLLPPKSRLRVPIQVSALGLLTLSTRLPLCVPKHAVTLSHNNFEI